MDVLTASGLAAPAGLNAPLVLLLTALTARFTDALELPADFDWLQSTPALVALAGWLVVEEVLDKVAGVDTANDAVNTLLRPAAGAVLATAFAQEELSPVLTSVLGVVLAGSTHAVKAGLRPAVSLGSLGLGNPVVSAVEDALAVLAVLVAIAVPVLVVLVLAALLVALVLVARRTITR